MGIDASGLNSLANDLGKGSRAVGKLAQVIVRKTAKDIEGTAKRLAPVDTGNLKNSIGTSDLRSTGIAGNITAEIGPTVSYGKYLEFGTSRMGPQPYMNPAADMHEPAFIAAFEQLAERALNG